MDWCKPLPLLVLVALGCTPRQQFASLGDCPLENGGVIRDCRIGYRTFGQLNDLRSNAVLVPCWAMGTSQDLSSLIGRGRLVDSSRYFVIAVDAFGNGVSSSPSNSPQQPGTAFPSFSVRDLVESQYRLVTRELGVPRLKAVVGTSLGGMQAFAWAMVHPEAVDAVVAIAGSPGASPEDRRRWQRFIEEARQRPGASAEDFVRQAQAIRDWDVAKAFDGSMERAASALRPRLMVAVSARDDVVDPGPARAFARLARASLLELDGRCGHSAPSCEKARLWPAVAAFLAK
jgi:homoserine O-acetyltransferase